MSRVARLLPMVLLLGATGSVIGIGITILVNWFFRGEAGISRDEIERVILLCFVIGCMPLGVVWWARSRKEKR